MREMLLADGDKTLGLGCGDGVEADGGTALAVPRTRPPPSVLRGMVKGDYWSMGRRIREKRKTTRLRR